MITEDFVDGHGGRRRRSWRTSSMVMEDSSMTMEDSSMTMEDFVDDHGGFRR